MQQSLSRFQRTKGLQQYLRTQSVLIGYRHYRAVITRYKFAIFVGRKPFLPGKFFEGHKRGRPMGRERGSRTGRCQGCKHLERARIERLLAAGASIKGTARKFAIDHHALRRHWINHISARKGRVSNDAMPASEKPTTGRSAILLHSLQSALLFGVFETARLIGRLGTPLLFLGELSGRQSRRLSPVELVNALVGHR